jgi:hypothetical protein
MALRYKHSRSAELRAEAIARVMRWVLAAISDEKKTAINVSGNECGHAACGASDTIILLRRAGEQTIRLKIAKPIETVTQAEIADAFASLITKKELL